MKRRDHTPSRPRRPRVGGAMILHYSVPFLLCVLLGCQKPSPISKSDPPAKVAQPGDEKTLNTITLTEQANQRLGIRTSKIVSAEVRRKIALGAEVLIPPGNSVTISAPFTGTLSAPMGKSVPAPGNQLTEGIPVLELMPVLTPERDVLTPADRVRVAQTKADVATAKIEAARQVESAKVEVSRMQIAFDRAAVLLKDKAGSQRSVDEATAQLKLAQESLRAAQTRSEFLSQVTFDTEAGDSKSRAITSPITGTLQSLDAAPGQSVAAGERLFQVVNLERVWVRVPVYVGQRHEVDTAQDATVAEYGAANSSSTRAAKFVSGPPSANAAAASIDLYFEVDNANHQLHPGQKVSATLALKSRAQSLVIPWSAVLHDIHGNTWVYEQTAPHTFVRRRVDVDYVEAPNAVLVSGPPAGSEIVIEGAAELFGTEFGMGK